MEEDMSAKKKIIKITFGAAAIMMLLSGRNTAKVRHRLCRKMVCVTALSKMKRMANGI